MISFSSQYSLGPSRHCSKCSGKGYYTDKNGNNANCYLCSISGNTNMISYTSPIAGGASIVPNSAAAKPVNYVSTFTAPISPTYLNGGVPFGYLGDIFGHRKHRGGFCHKCENTGIKIRNGKKCHSRKHPRN